MTNKELNWYKLKKFTSEGQNFDKEKITNDMKAKKKV